MTDTLHVVHARAAGLDVHKMQITASVRLCAPGAGVPQVETRTFEALASGLDAMVAWLHERSVDAAVMEGTGVYWLAPFEALEAGGIRARDASIATKARAVPFDAETVQRNLGRASCCAASAASGSTPTRWSPATGRAPRLVGRPCTRSTPHRKSSWPTRGSTTRRRDARHCPTPTTNSARGAPCRRSSGWT